ncbi:7-dehydrocholesterol reductase [Hyphodiscus hymeniophilus]|uniref:7-dehydrocholesterol reductase n=1 Tax=Hyphodiscus hymeniophilus TaxID=353542 RepID=A0A9P6VF56_9HELO|nr:7-dehydrocholesterol reductase [Hyphodiscus hymeniophilus]
MDPIILPSPNRHAPTEIPQSTEKNGLPIPQLASFFATHDSTVSWGRRGHHGSWKHALGCASIMILCPLLVVFYWVALASFQGSLLAAWQAMLTLGPISFFWSHAPRADYKVHLVYGSYMLCQAGLYHFLPGTWSIGQLTPAGHLLEYRTNGFFAWAFTHLLFGASVLQGCIDPAIIARNWEPLLATANICGLAVSLFVFIKAHLFPTHEGDRKFSGSMWYDLYMGIEFNPRLGRYFDFKLFCNGRMGMLLWTLMPSDLSFVAYQYQLHGFITKSIVIATIFHTVYTVDFFINEDWYLRTIDICHDHFGFYLAWGCIVWLPSIYTLQTQYLAYNPVHLSNFHAAAILVAGVGGYAIFRSVNHQKDLVRRMKGDCELWGAPAKVIRVKYQTKDGLVHERNVVDDEECLSEVTGGRMG